MTPEEFALYREQVIAFAYEVDFKDQPTRYYLHRKKLVELSKDRSLDLSLQREALWLNSQLKWAFAAVIGAYDKRLRDHIKSYPESSPYGSGQSLTSKYHKLVTISPEFTRWD